MVPRYCRSVFLFHPAHICHKSFQLLAQLALAIYQIHKNNIRVSL